MKTVFITGANKGIGYETAKQLAQLNYFVYLGSRDKEQGLDAIKKLNGLGLTNVESIVIDVTDLNTIQQARQELEGKISSLDVLINNAGIIGEHSRQPSILELQDLQDVLDTNFYGIIRTTQEFISLLKKSAEPRIVNVSSELGSLTIHSDPSWGAYESAKVFTAYSISKSAVNAFTVALAYEFKGTNFKINSVSPGHTATDLNQFTGTKTVTQGARPIVKFATLDANGVTGKFYKDEGEIPW